jgi:hypothetical protein
MGSGDGAVRSKGRVDVTEEVLKWWPVPGVASEGSVKLLEEPRDL